ncbi:hypothetical protein Q3C01_19465 [Bradyrhizobium sp. UFLA05-109]
MASIAGLPRRLYRYRRLDRGIKLIDGLGHPGGNITRPSIMFGELDAKRLGSAQRQLHPIAKRVPAD